MRIPDFENITVVEKKGAAAFGILMTNHGGRRFRQREFEVMSLSL
jgi:hypothetical protein